MKVCDWCGEEFKRISNRQKYCPKCGVKVKLEQWRINSKKYRDKDREKYNELASIRMEKYRERWKILKQYRYEAISEAYREHGDIMNHYHCGKGTGSLGPHCRPNFKLELKLIKKEKRRLGIE
jgi:hypothetical protein